MAITHLAKRCPKTREDGPDDHRAEGDRRVAIIASVDEEARDVQTGGNDWFALDVDDFLAGEGIILEFIGNVDGGCGAKVLLHYPPLGLLVDRGSGGPRRGSGELGQLAIVRSHKNRYSGGGGTEL